MKAAALAVAIAVLAALALFALFTPWRSGQPAADDIWTVAVTDGKTETIQVDYRAIQVDLGDYYGSLRRVFPGNFIGTADDAAAAKERGLYRNLTVTSAGSWAGYEVLTITCTAADHLGIALKDAAGVVRLVYLEFGRDPYYGTAAKPVIRTIAGHSLLSYECSLVGTGSARIEHHFLFDEQRRRPRLLDLSAIDAAIKKTLPVDHGVWKGGGLDLARLRYAHHVWKRSDANCCPSGGSIELDLAIRDFRLVVVAARYDPRATSR